LQDLKIELIEKGVNIYEVLKEQKEQEDENKDKKEGKKQETNDDKLKTALDYSSDITIITRT
jgi:uncharacterized membrane protein YcaP (DUF421 family)